MPVTEGIVALGENSSLGGPAIPLGNGKTAAPLIGIPGPVDDVPPPAEPEQEEHNPDAAGRGIPPVAEAAPGAESEKDISRARPPDTEATAGSLGLPFNGGFIFLFLLLILVIFTVPFVWNEKSI